MNFGPQFKCPPDKIPAFRPVSILYIAITNTCVNKYCETRENKEQNAEKKEKKKKKNIEDYLLPPIPPSPSPARPRGAIGRAPDL